MSEIAMMLAYPSDEPKIDKAGLPEGMVDYDLRCAMRNFHRVYGFEELREKAAVLMDELAGKRLS